MKTCTLCKLSKPLIEFNKQKLGRDGLRSRCKICERKLSKIWRDNNPDKDWNKAHAEHYKNWRANIGRYQKHGITKDIFDAIFKRQDYSCAICGRTKTIKWCIDHDHNCCPDSSKSCGKCVRGILCPVCNTSLGWYERRKLKISEYLRNKQMAKMKEASGEHDQLVPQTVGQKDPYQAKASEFPLSEVNDGTGQSGKHGMAEGANQLATQNTNQVGPRHTEDSGPGEHGSGTPTNWEAGGRSAIVSKNFSVGKSPSRGTSVSSPYGIDCETGKLEGLDEHYYSTSVD